MAVYERGEIRIQRSIAIKRPVAAEAPQRAPAARSRRCLFWRLPTWNEPASKISRLSSARH